MLTPASRARKKLPEERHQGRRHAELDSLLRDLRDLISTAGTADKAHRERLLRHLESADKAHALELTKYSPVRYARVREDLVLELGVAGAILECGFDKTDPPPPFTQ